MRDLDSTMNETPAYSLDQGNSRSSYFKRLRYLEWACGIGIAPIPAFARPEQTLTGQLGLDQIRRTDSEDAHRFLRPYPG